MTPPPPPPQCHICGFKKIINIPYFCVLGSQTGDRQFSNCTPPCGFSMGSPPRPNGEALRGNIWETCVSPPLAQEKGTPW